MNIDAFLPLNTKEKIDALMAELTNCPGAMNPSVRLFILEKIIKAKLQIYFNEQYPETRFSDPPKKLNIIIGGTKAATTPPVPTAPKPQQEKTTCEIPLPSNSMGAKKHIYGTYIEMAFHNFFINIQHIYAIVFGADILEEARERAENKFAGQTYDNGKPKQWDEDFANEEFIWEPFFTAIENARPEERLKVEELLKRHFPMLECALDYTKNSRSYKDLDTIEILRRMSKSLRILRNVYSHYRFKPYPNQVNDYIGNEELIDGILQHAYLGAKRIVKSRFAFDDRAMRCTEQYSFFTDYRQRDKCGRPLKVKEEIPGFKYRLTERNNHHLTVFGIVFLSSLFLEKKFSKILSDKARCIPQEDQAVVCEMLAVYRLRLHTEKFYATTDTDALAFDILTELRRCPKELFELLKPADQKKFRVTEDADAEEVNGTLMLRKRDRFAHLVMKYIDEAKLFNDIRFQVSLGNYFFRFYDKQCIDNASEPRVRALSKHVNGFGRIDEIEAARTAVWNELIRDFDDFHKNTVNESPYITDHHARYVIGEQRIAMRIFEGNEERIHLPELTPEGAGNLPPTCFLSTYELPAMAFLMHLQGGASRVEEIIKSAVANYRKLFSDVANGVLLPVSNDQEMARVLAENYNGMQPADVPEDIKDYLTGRTKEARKMFRESAARLIDALIEQTEYKIDRFKAQLKAVEGKDNKIGKKSYVSIQPGRLAAFLAKDIMFFQPNNAENSNKLTSLNFRVLQSVLALYQEGEAENLKRTLEAAHILGAKGDAMCNPIMMRLWQRPVCPANIRELYKAYLEERLAYLRQCKQEQPETLPFIHADRVRWQEHDEDFYKSKAGRYLYDNHSGEVHDKAIELPRGLFEQAIHKELLSMPSMQADAVNADNNVAYLIYGYLKKVMKDDCQPVYEASRNYPLLNLLYRPKPTADKPYYSAQQIRDALMRKSPKSIRKDIEAYVLSMPRREQADAKDHASRLMKNLKDNETLLKRFKTQDIILFLIAKRILMANENDKERAVALDNIHLREIQEKSALSQKINFSVTIASKNCKKKLVKQADLKLKDYAKFYRFLYDRRLPSLLDLAPYMVERSLLEEELSGYDKVHPGILEQVFEYEKDFLNQHCEEKAPTEFGAMIKADESVNNEDKQQLKTIRNSFAHCSYPPYWHIGEKAQKEILPKKATSISETFVEKIKKVKK